MRRRCGGIITVLLLCLGAIAPGAYASAEKITFGTAAVDSSEGNTRVAVTALRVPAPAEACLVAAYVKTQTGEIVSINASQDRLEKDGDTLETVLTDRSGEGIELKYYLWNGLYGRVPLRNGAPAAPASAEVRETSLDSARIEWTAALDDYDSVEKYNIYDEGMLIKEGVTETGGVVDGLQWGAEYRLEVKAVDDEGMESAEGALAVATTRTAPNSVTAGDSIVHDEESRLQFVLMTGENYNATTAVNAGGLDCRETLLTPGGRATFFNYRFSTQYLQTIQDEKDFVLEVTYFDEGTETVGINLYGYVDSKGKETDFAMSEAMLSEGKLPVKQNTMTWKTARVKFTIPGHFTENTNAGNAYYNFRIRDNDLQGGLKLYRLSVMPQSSYNPTDAYFVSEEVNRTCGMDTAAAAEEKTEKEGRSAVRLSEFTFTVTDSVVQNAAGACVEINYYAEAPSAVRLDGGGCAELTGGKWQKMKMDLEECGAGEHTIATEDGSKIYIHSVRVVPKA